MKEKSQQCSDSEASLDGTDRSQRRLLVSETFEVWHEAVRCVEWYGKMLWVSVGMKKVV